MADYNRQDRNGFRYEIVKPLGVLSERTIQGEPWVLEANLIAWNGRAPKIDIRSWDKRTHSQMTKGITLTNKEAETLAEIVRGL